VKSEMEGNLGVTIWKTPECPVYVSASELSSGKSEVAALLSPTGDKSAMPFCTCFLLAYCLKIFPQQTVQSFRPFIPRERPHLSNCTQWFLGRTLGLRFSQGNLEWKVIWSCLKKPQGSRRAPSSSDSRTQDKSGRAETAITYSPPLEPLEA
jgi:hypothetical protein